MDPSTEMLLLEHASRIRKNALKMIYLARSGHPGGSLSVADLLTWLFMVELRLDPDKPDWPERDRLVLSKGHSCPALYAAGAERGLLEHDELWSFRKLGSPLQGHTHVGSLPWVEASTGSLGQGFSVALGIAMGLRLLQISARVYVILGDGELQEGEIWEGAMCAAHHRLSNLCAIVDYNKMQSDDLNQQIVDLEPLADKWRAFNWHVSEIDGHDFARIKAALQEARTRGDRPTMIIAHTIKGKGVSYMEGSPLWHGSLELREEELIWALEDLGASEKEIEGCIAHGAR